MSTYTVKCWYAFLEFTITMVMFCDYPFQFLISFILSRVSLFHFYYCPVPSDVMSWNGCGPPQRWTGCRPPSGPSSATSTRRSPWSSSVRHVTCSPAGTVSCSSTRTTGNAQQVERTACWVDHGPSSAFCCVLISEPYFVVLCFGLA